MRGALTGTLTRWTLQRPALMLVVCLVVTLVVLALSDAAPAPVSWVLLACGLVGVLLVGAIGRVLVWDRYRHVDHRISVRQAKGHRYLAACSCGWRSAKTGTPAQARRLGRHHAG